MKSLLTGIILTFAALTAHAETVLLNFHDPQCSHCMMFQNEIGKDLFDTNEVMVKAGVTMMVLDFSKPAPAWIIPQYREGGSINPIPGTPTFVLYDLDEFEELGRFSGYGSAERFWRETHKLLKAAGMME